ncbi:MAG TPA: flagellar basal body L-ring protein FlgH [Gemmatimonadaceae bacterium]|nr:flagellar basal body L-ring protein FlgH [Gemmatimonadaceae bacterium]
MITLLTPNASSRFSRLRPFVGLWFIVPCLAGAQQAPRPLTPPAAVTAAVPTTAGRQSWTADRMPLAVGDIITVNVDEHLLATSDLKNSADDQRTKNLGATVATPGASPQASINTQNAGHSQSEGQASRTNDFVGSISTRVVAVSPAGLLQVKGSKLVALDKVTEEVTIAGWIRPDDVSSTNTIDSWRIADAQLAYHATGDPDKPKSSLIMRILGAIWP